jgi:large subunit ribosomal protein L15
MTVGRGGKRGKTAGRGTKGQNSRAGRKKRPEMRDFIKRLPKLRGYAFNTIQDKDAVVNIREIEKAYKAGEIVNPTTLVEKGLVDLFKGNNPVIKILSSGDLTKKITVEACAVSAGAKAKIEKAGGKVSA